MNIAALRNYLLYFLLPLLIVWLLSEILINYPTNILYLDKYSPKRTELSLHARSEAQVLHAHAESIRGDRIALIGSSSVTNGIDEELINAKLKDSKINTLVSNIGITGLMATELPMLSNILLSNGYQGIVYLYNSFSFSDELQRYVLTRGDLSKFAKFAGPQYWLRDEFDVFASLTSELSSFLRYKNILRHTIISGSLLRKEIPTNLYDYPIGGSALLPQPRSESDWPEVDEDNWGRKIYLSADRMPNSLGYRGFEYFLMQAQQAGVDVVVMPIPEPEFALFTGNKHGIDMDKIDARVKSLCDEFDVAYFPRSEIKHIEREDTLFRDPVHLHDAGREIYSNFLAAKLLQYFVIP